MYRAMPYPDTCDNWAGTLRLFKKVFFIDQSFFIRNTVNDGFLCM